MPNGAAGEAGAPKPGAPGDPKPGVAGALNAGVADCPKPAPQKTFPFVPESKSIYCRIM